MRPPTGPPRLEVGGQVGVIGVYPVAAVLFLGGPRLAVNLTPRDAVEAMAEAAGLSRAPASMGSTAFNTSAGSERASRRAGDGS